MKINKHQARRRLVCPECGEAAQQCPPRRWVAVTGPRPRWSHRDGTPLCPVVGPAGYRPADPCPALPVRQVRRPIPAPLPGLSDLQTEALRECADPIAVGGESDWDVAVYVYALHAPLIYPGCVVPAGAYVRTVQYKREDAYPVTDTAAAVAYAEQTERHHLAWAEATG